MRDCTLIRAELILLGRDGSGVISCGWRFGFYVEVNSSFSFAGRAVLAEKNITFETNLMVFEFFM